MMSRKSDNIFPIHPIDMTEVYEIQDGEAQCQGLFQSNTDTYLRESV